LSTFLHAGARTESKTLGIAFLFLWFAFALAMSLSGRLENVSSATLLISGSVIPAGSYFALYFGSARFRQFILGLDLRSVTLVQISRITGFIFFLEYSSGRLPALFSIPTGLSDAAVGITSPLVAFRLVSRQGLPKRGLACWHVFSMLAALLSGGLGILTSGTWLGFLAGEITSQAMSEFPLSLVPTFLGPVTLIFHLIALCIIHARRGETHSEV
jgi:hypothetical protein